MTHPIDKYVATNIATPEQIAEFNRFCLDSPDFIPGAFKGAWWTSPPKPKTITLDVEDLTAILDTLHALGEFVGASSHRHDAQIAAGIAHHTVVSLSDKHNLPEAQ